MALNFGMLLLMIVCMVLRGPGDGQASIIGVNYCDTGDFIFLAVIFVGSGLATFLAYFVAKSDYDQKKKVDYVFAKGDV